MHLMFLTRGEIHFVNRFIEELSTRYMPTKQCENGEMKEKFLQMRVCPVQLWDVSFPEEHKDVVLHTILKNNEGAISPAIKKFQWALQKGLKLDKIPEYSKGSVLVMSPPQHIEITGIGIKNDKWITEDGRFVDKKDKTPLSYEGI